MEMIWDTMMQMWRKCNVRQIKSSFYYVTSVVASFRSQSRQAQLMEPSMPGIKRDRFLSEANQSFIKREITLHWM